MSVVEYREYTIIPNKKAEADSRQLQIELSECLPRLTTHSSSTKQAAVQFLTGSHGPPMSQVCEFTSASSHSRPQI